jgi:DNA-binding NarL/FixJ family response regulator
VPNSKAPRAVTSWLNADVSLFTSLRHEPLHGGTTTAMPRFGGISDDAWVLTGRDAELQFIVKRLVERVPHCIVVTGDPGVGRTRLAKEALAAAREAGWRTLSATGTGAAAAVPLGAMAHLIPRADTALDPFTLLQRAMSAVADAGAGHPLVLVVDDAHLLDDLSQTLLQQLAASNTVSLVLTIRAGSAPGLAALYRDGAAERLDLQLLERAQSDRLLAAALGGDVDTRTCERLWRLTRGNPLFLRELVESGRRSGQLRRREGFWRWDGQMRPPPRLMEIVDAQLDGMDAAERAALEVLAVGEQLRMETLVEMSSTAAVAGLERAGLAIVEGTGRSAEVRVSHPLHAEVVRARMPEAAAIRTRQRLFDSATRHRSDDEVLRAGRLALDSAAPDMDVELLIDAAKSANTSLDHPLAERLARTAVDAGGGVDAHLALLEAVQWQGRSDEAESLARLAAPLALAAGERARLVVIRALNLFCGLGAFSDAERELNAAVATVRQPGARDELTSALAQVALLDGRPERAVELGKQVVSRSENRTCARPLAAAAAAGGLAMTGRTREALTVAETGWAALRSLPAGTETAFVQLALAQGELIALWLAGRFPELESRAAELHRESLTAPDWAGDAVAALQLGWAALGHGEVPAAGRWLAEATAGLRRRDPMGLLPLCASQLAQTCGLLGDTVGAAEALRTVDAVPRPMMRAYEPQILLGRAWAAVATDHHAAVDIALEAAGAAADVGQWAIEAAALQSVVQLGHPGDVARRLRTLAAQLDYPLAAIYADHAEAAAAGSGGRLDAVAADYERAGALLAAADASACATAAHRQRGDQRKASAAALKAAKLARACGRPRTPALLELSMPRLTSREAEVARYASAGLNNQEIAARLVVSVRTVEAHLANTYTKLGIRGRTHLREALAATAAQDGSR